MIPTTDLKPSPYNPRKISPEARAKLEKSLATFGLVDPLIVNAQTGMRVIGGHQRLEILKAHGIAEVPCVVLDIDEDREKMLNIALNNQNMAGEYEFSKLADLLLEFDQKNLDMSVIGFTDEELERIMNWTPDADSPCNQPQDEIDNRPLEVSCPRCGLKFRVAE
jgi:ParB-like chromosome segregation protein Spo0J